MDEPGRAPRCAKRRADKALRSSNSTSCQPPVRRTPVRRTAPAFVLTLATSWILAAAACEDDGQIGSPLSIELAGPGSGLVGVELSVQYSVAGRSLTGIFFEWGDGAVDSLPTSGAVTAAGSMQHTYADAGVFTVRAVAEDLVEGVASDAVDINIQQRQDQ